MGPCKCPEASKGIKGAWNIAKALGYKKQDTKLLLHPFPPAFTNVTWRNKK